MSIRKHNTCPDCEALERIVNLAESLVYNAYSLDETSFNPAEYAVDGDEFRLLHAALEGKTYTDGTPVGGKTQQRADEAEAEVERLRQLLDMSDWDHYILAIKESVCPNYS